MRGGREQGGSESARENRAAEGLYCEPWPGIYKEVDRQRLLRETLVVVGGKCAQYFRSCAHQAVHAGSGCLVSLTVKDVRTFWLLDEPSQFAFLFHLFIC